MLLDQSVSWRSNFTNLVRPLCLYTLFLVQSRRRLVLLIPSISNPQSFTLSTPNLFPWTSGESNSGPDNLLSIKIYMFMIYKSHRSLRDSFTDLCAYTISHNCPFFSYTQTTKLWGNHGLPLHHLIFKE